LSDVCVAGGWKLAAEGCEAAAGTSPVPAAVTGAMHDAAMHMRCKVANMHQVPAGASAFCLGPTGGKPMGH
jgi:hypothetical protein